MQLERALESVPNPLCPDANLEQVRTPPEIASGFLWLAHEEGLVANSRFLDLGCGTGIFSWGASLLGAHVTGVELDAPSLASAKTVTLPAPSPRWIQADVREWQPDATWDLVMMNPPFGAQKGNRHADRAFYEKAAQAVGRQGEVWFLALEHTGRFLDQMAKSLGAELEKVESWDYPLEAQHPWHTHEVQLLGVGGYRMYWK